MILDRAENTKHVGIVAGFYDLIPSKSSTLADNTFDTSRHGLLLTKKATTVTALNIEMFLGKDGLRLVKNDDES